MARFAKLKLLGSAADSKVPGPNAGRKLSDDWKENISDGALNNRHRGAMVPPSGERAHAGRVKARGGTGSVRKARALRYMAFYNWLNETNDSDNARLCGVTEATIRNWCRRENWATMAEVAVKRTQASQEKAVQSYVDKLLDTVSQHFDAGKLLRLTAMSILRKRAEEIRSGQEPPQAAFELRLLGGVIEQGIKLERQALGANRIEEAQTEKDEGPEPDVRRIRWEVPRKKPLPESTDSSVSATDAVIDVRMDEGDSETNMHRPN